MRRWWTRCVVSVIPVPCRSLTMTWPNQTRKHRPRTILAGPKPVPAIAEAKGRERVLQAIEWQQIKKGDYRAAFETVSRFDSRKDKDIALRYLVISQAEKGDVPGALETMAKIESDEEKAFA